MRVNSPAKGREPLRVGFLRENWMDTFLAVIGLLLVATVAASIQYFWPRPFTVRENQRGLRYRRGRLLGVSEPGRYWLRPRIDDIEVLDIRRRQETGSS